MGRGRPRRPAAPTGVASRNRVGFRPQNAPPKPRRVTRMTQTQLPEVDPLEAFESRPSVSFDVSRGGYAKGVKAHFVVESYGNLIVDRDPETKEINYWPLK